MIMSSRRIDEQVERLEGEGIYRTTMSAAMRTRNPSNAAMNLTGQTEFQMHVSQHTMMNGLLKKIIDYTEHRLIKYADTVVDAQQKLVLVALINDYKAGRVAVAWKRGLPLALRVTKD